MVVSENLSKKKSYTESHNSMQKNIFILCLCLSASCGAAFAQDELPVVVQDFDQYQTNAATYCDAPEREWAKTNTLVPIPQYPKLESTAINNQIARTQSLDTLTQSEKEKLKNDLNMNRIGDFSGYKTLEVARLQYRSTMDSLFACSVVESRLSILTGLQETIKKRIPNRNSEILQKLSKEEKLLRTQKNNLNCNSAGTSGNPPLRELINTSTRQYCHYRYYLTYLDTQLQTDRYTLEQIEKAVGVGSGTQSPTTIAEWNQSYRTHSNALALEIARAESTLPRALRAYQDMERSYPVHLMLTIIYDDYIRLRNNLAVYMNASSQLYMKAYNAQDANQR